MDIDLRLLLALPSLIWPSSSVKTTVLLHSLSAPRERQLRDDPGDTALGP